MQRDTRVEDYIERQADFARPILRHLRETVHAACPQVEEELKWGIPAFLLGGRILATMAAFKGHASFGFRQGSEVVPEEMRRDDGMGQFGKLMAIEDLPPRDRLAELVRKAAELAAAGAQPSPRKAARPPLPVPKDLAEALAASPAAAAVFQGFSPSCRREYVEWVAEAKRADTRARRIAQAVEWMAEGKRRHWKHEKC